MKIYPFAGVRPKNEIAGHLVTRPYKDYDIKELASQLDYNPFSFLQILNPGYRYHQNIKGESRFKLVHNRYQEFKEREFLQADDCPSYYIYRKTTAENIYTGIIANASAEDYHLNRIKKHENTIQSRVNLFTDYLKTVGYNAEPVLMTYEDHVDIDSFISDITTSAAADQRFCTSDMIRHEIWCIKDPMQIKVLSDLFDTIPQLYIADGHHRSASSVLLSDQNGQDNSSYQQFMTFILPESQLQIEMYCRMIKGLNGYSPEMLLLELDNHYQIEPLDLQVAAPTSPTELIMYLAPSFYRLTLRESGYDMDSPLSKLNTQLLYNTILEPILGIKDLRNDQRISYDLKGSDYLIMKQLIDQGTYDIGFSLFPLDFNHIKTVSEANMIMPPKSTCIYPKLYSGLIIYEYD